MTTRLDRILNIFDRYDKLISIYIDPSDETISKRELDELREDKDALTQELIEHGCRRRGDRIPQDIFSEKPAMKQETWSGGW